MSVISAAPAPQTSATGAGFRQPDAPAAGEPGDFATLLGALQAAEPAEEKAANASASSLVDVPVTEPTGWPLPSAAATPATPAADIALQPAIEPTLPPTVDDLSSDGSVLETVGSDETNADTAPRNVTASSALAPPILIPIPVPASPAVEVAMAVDLTPAATAATTAVGAPTLPLTTTPSLPLTATPARASASAPSPTAAASSGGNAPLAEQFSEPVPLAGAPASVPADTSALREAVPAEVAPTLEPAPPRAPSTALPHSPAVQMPGTPITGTVPLTVAGASVRSIAPLSDLPPTDNTAAPAVTAATVPAGVAAQPVVVPAPAAPQAAPAGPQAPPAPLATQLASPLFTLAGARAGEHLMTIQVNPDNLGPVTVRAVIGVDDIRIELFAPTDAGREAVRLILTDLRRDLAGGGLAASLDLSGKNAPEERREGQPQDSSPRNGAPSAEHTSTPRQSAEPSQVSTMTLDITV